MFNFCWLAGLIDGLKPCLPPLSSQKNEMLLFGLHSTSDDQPGWSMDSNPICHPSPAKKMKCSFLDYIPLLIISWDGRWTQTHPPPLSSQKTWNAPFWNTFNFCWSAGLLDGFKPHPSALSSQKNEILIIGLCSTSDDQLGWSMDWNPVHHPSPAKKMKCSFLDYVQLLMIGWAGRWTKTPSTTSLQPKKWNAHFWITFNFWWSARLVDGLKPHLPPLSSQKNEMLIFGLHSTLMTGWTGQWTQTPSTTPLQPKKLNDHFWIMFNFSWLAGLVNGLKPHLPPLSSQKNEMLVFGLRSTSEDWPGRPMDMNPIHHPSPTKKLKCSFLDYVLGWSMDLNPICHPSPAKKMKCSFSVYVQHLMIG